jgi:hypothetical protein
MKIFYILFLALIFNCSFKKGDFMLKHVDYYTVAPNYRVANIRTTEKLLSISYKKADKIEKEEEYQIVDEGKKEGYFLIYIKRDVPEYPAPTKNMETPSLFGSFVFAFSKDQSQLMVLHENKLWYSTLEEAKIASSNIAFESKHFNTWYAEPDFLSFAKFPSIDSADKSTIQQVSSSLIMDMESDRDRMKNTKRADIYGGEFLQNSLTKVLVANHLNPMVTISDLDKKVAEYHIAIPSLRQLKNTNVKPLRSGTRDSNTVINQPKTN